METKSYLLTDQLMDAALKIKKIDVLYQSKEEYPFIHKWGLLLSYAALFIALILAISLLFLDNKECINYYAFGLAFLVMGIVFGLMYWDNDILKKEIEKKAQKEEATEVEKEQIDNSSSFWADSPDLNKWWIDRVRDQFVVKGILKGEDSIDFLCIERYIAEIKALLDDSSFFREAKKELGGPAIVLSLTCVFLTYVFDKIDGLPIGWVFGICVITGSFLYLMISARHWINEAFFQDKRAKSLRETYTILKLMKGRIMGKNDIAKFL